MTTRITSDLVTRLRERATFLDGVAEGGDDASIVAVLLEAAERIEALERACAPFAREARNWPDYVPDSDGVFIASPEDVMPILDEHAAEIGRVSCGISYSDDTVTVGDLRAAAHLMTGTGDAL